MNIDDIHGRDLNGEQMARLLDEFCNSSSCKPTDKKVKDFTSFITNNVHRTIQQKIMGVVVSLLETWAEKTSYDARNEATVKLCQKLISTTDKYDRCLPYI